jgi:hypothetical protein
MNLFGKRKSDVEDALAAANKIHDKVVLSAASRMREAMLLKELPFDEQGRMIGLAQQYALAMLRANPLLGEKAVELRDVVLTELERLGLIELKRADSK